MDARLLPLIDARPVSEVEWEDLLVRFELMTRALRVSLEAVEDRGEALAVPLRSLVAREARLAPWLLALADGDPDPAARVPEDPEVPGDVAGLAEHFVRLRGRNFVMMQRRGVEVWAWGGEFPGLGHVSVYQLLCLMVEADGRALAQLRQPASQGGVC